MRVLAIAFLATPALADDCRPLDAWRQDLADAEQHEILRARVGDMLTLIYSDRDGRFVQFLIKPDGEACAVISGGTDLHIMVGVLG